MARIVNGRYTARMDEPFVAFMIKIWYLHHKGRWLQAGAVPDCRLADNNAPTV